MIGESSLSFLPLILKLHSLLQLIFLNIYFSKEVKLLVKLDHLSLLLFPGLISPLGFRFYFCINVVVNILYFYSVVVLNSLVY